MSWWLKSTANLPLSGVKLLKSRKQTSDLTFANVWLYQPSVGSWNKDYVPEPKFNCATEQRRRADWRVNSASHRVNSAAPGSVESRTRALRRDAGGAGSLDTDVTHVVDGRERMEWEEDVSVPAARTSGRGEGREECVPVGRGARAELRKRPANWWRAVWGGKDALRWRAQITGCTVAVGSRERTEWACSGKDLPGGQPHMYNAQRRGKALAFLSVHGDEADGKEHGCVRIRGRSGMHGRKTASVSSQRRAGEGQGEGQEREGDAVLVGAGGGGCTGVAGERARSCVNGWRALGAGRWDVSEMRSGGVFGFVDVALRNAALVSVWYLNATHLYLKPPPSWMLAASESGKAGRWSSKLALLLERSVDAIIEWMDVSLRQRSCTATLIRIGPITKDSDSISQDNSGAPPDVLFEEISDVPAAYTLHTGAQHEERREYSMWAAGTRQRG
ncbi:hypothetical protein C8R43DRAFT_963205 [Mycena crocata]|nr:hypothetical protein C8R43DRAFT_963205 [Mycena crocata]